jgi:hypothetical protein
MIGRAAKEPVCHVGDHAMGTHATAQIILRADLQVIHAVLLTVFGERHDLAIGGVGLHVVDRRNGALALRRRSGSSRRPPFASDVDGSSLGRRVIEAVVGKVFITEQLRLLGAQG